MPRPAVRARIAVVTVTYRSAGEIVAFLDSVGRSQGEPVLSVVADNASDQTRDTVVLARQHGAEVIELADNRGYGSAANAAVAALPPDVDYVLVSNPDVRLGTDSIVRLASALDRDARLAAVGPRILNEDGSVYPSARNIPSLRTGLGHALLFRLWPRNPWTRAYRQEGHPPEQSRDVGWLSGACLMVRRSAFEQVGGFDESYFMYFEDVDLGYRLGKAGWRNHYDPGAEVVHFGARSTATESHQMLRIHHESANRFLARKYRGWYLAPVRGALSLGLRVRARWLTRH